MKTIRQSGTWTTIKVAGEPYKAYVPNKLPPHPPIDVNHFSAQLEKTTLLLGELNNASKTIPNHVLFIYMYVRKEALLSSQIEGTQSSFSDLILFENKQKPDISIDDVEEVSNYVKAIYYGLKRLKDGFPLCLRLIREIHGILLQGGRGAQKSPGEFRQTQNWIGGTRPGNALFVPPPPEKLMECLNDLEIFLHEENSNLPILMKAALIHMQFETIHPFLDGNGRMGRLLIILLFCEHKILEHPILYLSLYLKQNKNLYYKLLQEVRIHGNWETWCEFFLDGVYKTAKDAINTIEKINKIFHHDVEKINSLGKARFSCLSTFEYLKRCPQVSVKMLAEELKISSPTARNSLNLLVQLKIIKEVSDKKRDKVYVYKKYLSLLEAGAETSS